MRDGVAGRPVANLDFQQQDTNPDVNYIRGNKKMAKKSPSTACSGATKIATYEKKYETLAQLRA